MRSIELAGSVAAGKSSMASHVAELVVEAGLVLHEDGEERPEGLRSSARLRARGLLDRVRALAAFALRYPALSGELAGAVVSLPLPWWHRRAIARLLLRLATQTVARDRCTEDGWLVVDEGWVQRSVNLFAWHERVQPGRVAAYVDRIPLDGPVVIVTAPPELRRERLEARGLPKRLHGKEPNQVAAFLERADAVLDEAHRALAARGVPVIRVDNATSLKAAMADLRRQLPPLLARAADHWCITSPVWKPLLPIRLPRPRLRRVALGKPSEPLPEPGLIEAIDCFGMRLLAPPRPAGRGGRSTTRIVVTDRGTLVLKRYKASVASDAIRSEHAVLGQLAELGFAAPRLVPSPGGETLVETTAGRFALFELLEGYRRADEQLLPGADRRRLSHAAGSALAAFHNVLAGFTPPGVNKNGFVSRDGRRTRPLAWYLDRLAACTTGSEDGADAALRESASWLGEALTRLDAQLDLADPPRLVIHGDVGPYNLLIRARAPLVFIDLELARLDWRLTDLATGLPRFGGRRSGPAPLEAFLAGYRSCADVTAAELALLPDVLAFLSLRRAVVCWSRYREQHEQRWIEEARAKLGVVRALSSGRHPLATLARTLGGQ